MRGTALAFNRFLALLLSFLLGFLSFAGILVGAGYLVYSQLSVDALNKLGMNIETEEFIDPNAEQPLTSMTLQKLIEEIQTLSQIADEVDIDMLIERYGLKLDEETSKIIPDGVKKIPLSELFGPEGGLVLLDNVEVSYVLGLVPEGFISDPMIEALSDNTLRDIVDGDLAYLFDGVDLGFLIGVTYEKNENGEYEIVYAEEGNPTFLELLAPLDLGGLLGSVAEGNLDLISVIEDNFMDLEIADVIKSFSGSDEELPPFLEGKLIGDIIKTEDGESVIDIIALLEGESVGSLIGYEYKDITADGVDNPEWVLKDTDEPADSITAALCDISLSDLLAEDADPMQIVMDSLGGNTLGSLMGYELVDGVWQDADGNEADSMTASLCPIELSDLISEDADPMETIMDSLGGNTLGSLMGYELVDGVWQDADGNEADSMTASLCPIELSDLISEDADPMETIMDSLGGNTLGSLMGYELVDGVWVDEAGVEADSMTASLCPIELSDLISEDADPMEAIMDSIGTNTLGSLMGYELVDGVWVDEEGVEADSMTASLCPIELSDLISEDADPMQTITDSLGTNTLGDLMGYELVDGVWVDEEGVEADSVTASLCPILFSDLISDEADPMDTIMDSLGTNTLGEIMGYELVDGVWQDADGNEADALFQAICGVLLEDLMDSDSENNAIVDAFGESGTTLGGLMGYEYKDITPDDGIDNPVWATEDNEEADSLFAALCDVELYDLMKDGADPSGEIMKALDGTTLGEIMGYELVDGVWVDEDGEPADALFAALCTVNLYHLMEPSEYRDSEGNPDPEITTASDVIMNAFKDSETALGDIMGYTKEDGKWYSTDDSGVKTEVTGVGAIVADYSLYDVMNDGLDTDEIMSDLTIAKVYNLEKVENLPVYLNDTLIPGFTFGVWFDGNEPASSIISSLAEYNVDELNEKIDTLEIADVIGLVEYDGEYYKWTVVDGKTGYITLELDDSLTAEFASLSLKSFQGNAAPGEPTIDSTIQNISISKVLGYTKIDGKWCKDGKEVTGIMASIADSKVGNLTADIDELKIGEVAGYTYDGVTGKWTKTEGGEIIEASGIIGAFADLTIKQMTDESELSKKIKDVEVGTLLGYNYKDETDDGIDNGKWYQTVDGVEKEVTGITGSIAGFTVAGLDSGINTLEVGKLLGYAKTDDGWVDENGDKVTGIMGSIADSQVDTLTDDVNNLKIGEIAGYTYDDVTKKWTKTEDGEIIEASGIIGAFADLTIKQMTDESELSNKIKDVEVGTLLGYNYKDETDDGIDNGKWYQTVDGVDKEVTGITGAIAGFTVAGLDSGINTLEVGKLLGYTKTGDGWLDSEGKPVTGIMASVAGSQVQNLTDDINEIKIGEIAGYTYDDVTKKWTKTEGGEIIEASGIIGAFADLTIKQMTDESELSKKIKDVEVGTLLGYKYIDETDDGIDNGKWYQTVDGVDKEVTGITGSIAGFTVAGLDSGINSLQIGKLLGYTQSGEGWVDSEGNAVTGIMASVSGFTVESLATDIEKLQIGEIMGYHYNEADGKWYHNKNGNTYTGKVTGIMGAISGFTSANLENGIKDVEFGKVAGYEKIGDKWYTEGGKEASGIIKALAELKIDDLKNENKLAQELQKVQIGDIMGYTYENGNWYTDNSGVKTEVTGIMAVIADTEPTNIESKIKGTELGELLNYQKVDGKWANDDTGVELHVLMKKIASYKLDEIGSITEDLRLQDLFKETELSNGYLSLLDPETKLPDLPGEINKIFTSKNMGTFEDAGIVKNVPDSIKHLTIQQVIDYISSIPTVK